MWLQTGRRLARNILSRQLVLNRRTVTTTSGLAKSRYEHEFQRSIQDPEGYWGEIAGDIVWTKPFDKVMDNSNPPFTEWFVGGRLSLCYNAIDRHVDEGRGQRKALIWDSPITGNKSARTWYQLQHEVSRMAGMLVKKGVKPGDRVLIYMPMIPEAVVGMLAAVRIGAVHSVVFGGFAAKELAIRIRHTQPKLILTASCGVEPTRIIEYKPIVDEALNMADAQDTPCIVFQRQNLPQARLRSGGIDDVWQDLLAAAPPHDCIDVGSNDPLYILYTSGTTGNPKGIQHPTGSHAVVNRWTMNALYGLNPGDVWWAASDLGWIVGHEYICYSPLLGGNTTVVYEGKPVGTPDAGQFSRVIEENNVKALFTAPTALRAIKMADKDGVEGAKYNVDSLQYLFVAGEHCDHSTRLWAEKHFNVPVMDNWWQTETAHAITATCVGLGNRLAPPENVSGKPVPGFDVKIVLEDGKEAGVAELGRIVCKLPLAPGTMTTLYNADERFVDTYFKSYPGYYDTCDAGFRDIEGYISVVARGDDVINVAGHRLSTAALEEVAYKHPEIADVAVVGIPDDLKGQVPLALYIVKPGMSGKTIHEDLVQMMRAQVGAVAAFKLSVRIDDLPQTRSGKTPRKTLADLAAGKEVKIPPTVENGHVYEAIRNALIENGLLKT